MQTRCKFALIATLIAAVVLAPRPSLGGLPVTASSVKTGFVKLDDLQLRYRTIGTGEPVLILSGGPGDDSQYMLPVANDVATVGQAVLVDLRGTGKSMPAVINHDTVNLSKYLSDIESLRAHLKIEHWSVLGHSAGGLLAMYYAVAHPGRVHKLVLLDSAPAAQKFLDALDDNITARLYPSEIIRIKQLQKGRGTNEAISLLQLPAFFFSRKIASSVATKIRDGSFGKHHLDVARLLASDMFAGYDLRSQLRRFSWPVLVLNGRQDPMDPRTAYETALAFPHATLKFINRAGHFPWIEQPKKFKEVLTSFLRGRDS